MKQKSLVVRGIWFYGLSGSGKTYASSLFIDKITNSFAIDGDSVRRHVSQDLGYSIEDRRKQIKRILGVSLISLENGYFPVSSSVLMNRDVLEICSENMIQVIEIQRCWKQLFNARPLYNSETNVVGLDIEQQQLDTLKFFNNGSKDFDRILMKYAKQAQLF